MRTHLFGRLWPLWLLCWLWLPGMVWSQGNIGLVWSPPLVVAGGAAYDNIRPQLTLAGEVPLVIWCKAIGGRNGYVTRWNGSGFDTPTKINPTGSVNAYTVEGPNIVARGDTAYLVYVSYPPGSAQVMLRRSFDAGQTWQAPVVVDSLGADMPTFANVEVMPGGHPIVTYIRQTTTYLNPRWVVRASTNAGSTWQPEVVASGAAPGSLVCDCCTGHTYFHGGKLIEVFRNNDSNLRDFWATVSLDGGLSFANAIDLDTTDWTLAGCPSSGSASGFHGDSIYTAFMSQGSNGLARVWLGAAHLATGQSAYNLMLEGNVAPGTIQNYTAMAQSADTMLIAWMQSSGGNPDVMLRYSFRGIAGLWDHPAVNVSELATGSQSFPDVAFHNGRLHMVWQDDATNQVMYRSANVGVMASSMGTEWAWQIAPNPSNGHISINGLPDRPCRLALYDPSGRLVHHGTQAGGKLITLDLEALPNGVYFLEVTAEGAYPAVKKLLLQH